MKRLTRNNLLLVIAWLLIAWTTSVAAQSPAVVYLEPAELVLPAGETTTLTIKVEGVIDLFGIELHLVYDPAVVQVLDDDASREGVQLTPGGLLDPAEGFLVVNSADNETGELDYAMTLLAPAEAVSGDGILATFDLHALSDGTSPLTLSAILASAEGAALPVIVEGGRVTVGDDQANASSPTSPAAVSPATVPAESTAGATATPSGETLPLTATAEGPAGGIRTATPAETPPATDSGSEASGSTESPVETNPTTSVQAMLPALSQNQGDGDEANRPGSQDQPASIADSESGDQPADQDGDQAAVSGPAIPGQGTAADTESQAESTGNSVMVGGLALLVFLLIAAAIFFGRRLLSRE